MESLSYGDVSFQVLSTNSITAEDVYGEDGTTTQAIKQTIDVNCVFNRKAMSFTADTVTSGGVSGQEPGTTWNALKEYLLVPRRTLVIRNGDTETLRSPVTGRSVDVRGGPFPEVVDIAETHGIKTWVVRFRIVTFTAACRDGENALVYHRWERSHGVDQDFYTTVTTRGEARFRLDLVLPGTTPGDPTPAIPDSYRSQLFHQIPPNFRRDAIRVRLNSAGDGVFYEVVDVEKPLNLRNNLPAVRVEAMQTTYMTHGSIAQGLSSVFQSWASDTFQAGPLGLIGIPTNIATQYLSNLPKYHLTTICRAWGARGADRLAMTRLALAVCVSRQNNLPLGFLGQTEYTLTESLTENFVEATTTFRWNDSTFSGGFTVVGSPLASLCVGGGFGVGLFEALAYQPMDINVNEFGNIISAVNFSRNPSPPGGNGSRGTYLQYLVAQALTDPCTTVPIPPV